ncbi:MAG: flagellar basal body rod protein FlgB [Xanthobacteraceae bacterium]|nr:MAG: flagellar basal body rod protein FlgB [Xanthobacteraceae bacterium]
MPISQLPILSALRARMQWHQERQRVLSENVANADTPNFRPRDLAPLKFDTTSAAAPMGTLAMARTDAAHLVAGGDQGSGFASRKAGTETLPSGNAVSLEDEMMKVASNQMDYQAATMLYSRSLGLFKTAIGKR